MMPGRLPAVRFLPWAALAIFLSSSGCFFTHKRATPPPPPPDRPILPNEIYTLACPDVIEVVFADRPQLGPLARIGPDGCVDLGRLGSLRVEGDTVDQAAERIAERARVSPNSVLVQVAEYNSRQVFLYGPVKGEPRMVDYRGPETVIDLLKRTGGLTTDASPDEIYILRAQLSEGIPAEVLTVDLEAIAKNDLRTDIHVQPLDAIYVREKQRSLIGRAVPALFKPFYESIADLIPARKRSEKGKADAEK
jgi:protein involved in polysaccharide export with SLBB domain